jgi:hypothetical protein
VQMICELIKCGAAEAAEFVEKCTVTAWTHSSEGLT